MNEDDILVVESYLTEAHRLLVEVDRHLAINTEKSLATVLTLLVQTTAALRRADRYLRTSTGGE